MVQQVQASLCLPDDTEKKKEKKKISFNNKCTTTALRSMNATKMSGNMYCQGIYNRNTNCKMWLHQPSAHGAPPKSEGFHQVRSLSLARLSHPECGQNRLRHNHVSVTMDHADHKNVTFTPTPAGPGSPLSPFGPIGPFKSRQGM